MSISNEQILKMYEDPNIKAIYGFMYGTPFLDCHNHWEIDKAIKIKKEELQLAKDKKSFIYVWGLART